MPSPISADKIAALKAKSNKSSAVNPKFNRSLTYFPRFVDGKYVTLDLEDKYPCTVCKISTGIKVELVPYCSSHASYALFYIVDRLHRRVVELERATHGTMVREAVNSQ